MLWWSLLQLRSAKPDKSSRAAVVLASSANPRAVKPLIEALKDPRGGVRMNAAKALGGLGDARAIAPLIASLRDSENYVRDSAEAALVKTGPIAIELLGAALQGSSQSVRWAATRALGKIGDARAAEPLIGALADAYCIVRGEAAEGLGKIGSRLAIAPLVLSLNDANGSVRLSAAKALEALGYKPATHGEQAALLIARERWEDASLLRSAAVAPLSVALTSFDSPARNRAAEALGKIGDDQAIDPLLQALARSVSDPSLRSSLARALGRFRAERVLEPLIEVLSTAGPSVRASAAEALGTIGDVRAIGPLIQALQYPNVEVRNAAIGALQRLDRAPTIELLLAAFNDDKLRRHAAETLVALGYEPQEAWDKARLLVARQRWNEAVKLGAAAVGPLMAVFNRGGSRVDEPAEALIQIGAAAVAAVSSSLADSSPEVRSKAARVLERIGDPLAREALVGALEDSDSTVRFQAAAALGTIGDARATEALVGTLGDAVGAVRQGGARALGRLGGERAVDALIAALTDAEASVRLEAVEALARIGGARAVGPLIAALESHTLRSQAASALVRINDASSVKPLAAVLTNESRAHDNEGLVRAVVDVLNRTVLSWGSSSVAKEVFPSLLRVINRSFNPVRTPLAELLGKLGRARAIQPLLISLVNHRGLDGRDYEKVVTGAVERITPEWRERAIPVLLEAFAEGRERPYVVDLLDRWCADWGRSDAAQERLPALLEELDKGWAHSPWAGQFSPALVRALDRIDPEWVSQEGAQRGIPNLVYALVHAGGRDSELEWIVSTLDRIRPNWGESEILHGALADSLRSYETVPISVKEGVLGTIHRIVKLCASHLTLEELHAMTRLAGAAQEVWVESTATFPDEPNGYTARYKVDTSATRFLAEGELKRRARGEGRGDAPAPRSPS